MFIFEEPYVSPQLRRAATRLGAPVLDNACARRELRGVQLVGDDDFARRYFEQDRPRLYTNSENALGWIRDHLAGSDLPAQIEVLKDKVRFRELLVDLDPAYRFEEVRLADLDAVDPTIFAGPFVAKPAVGFFSLGVQIVEDAGDWPAAADRMQEFVDALCAAGLHPHRQVAIAEAFGGPSEICPGIVFEDLSPDNPFGGWIARAASEPESPKISGHA